MSPDDPSVPPVATLTIPVPRHQNPTTTPLPVPITAATTLDIDDAALGVPDAAGDEATHLGPRTAGMTATATHPVTATDTAAPTSPVPGRVPTAIGSDGLPAHLSPPGPGTSRPAVASDTRLDSVLALTAHPAASVCGRSMGFTATVAVPAAPDGTPPTGTVTFSADEGPACPVTLTGGVATFLTPLSAGAHAVTARYTGDTRVNPAPAATLTTWIWRTGFDTDQHHSSEAPKPTCCRERSPIIE
jgi:hypothetical protein